MVTRQPWAALPHFHNGCVLEEANRLLGAPALPRASRGATETITMKKILVYTGSIILPVLFAGAAYAAAVLTAPNGMTL